MSNHAILSAALQAAFAAQAANPAAYADAVASVLVAFADAVRGPAPTVTEFAATELVADETPKQILAELRKQTAVLETIASQGARLARLSEAVGSPLLSGAEHSGLPG